jgi:hypothetical protein
MVKQKKKGQWPDIRVTKMVPGRLKLEVSRLIYGIAWLLAFGVMDVSTLFAL